MQGSTLQSLRTVQMFLDDNAVRLADVIARGAKKQLDDIGAELTAHASDQSGENLVAQSATRRQRTLRTALLRDHMAPIARIARAELPASPETEPLKMPKGRPTSSRLAALAKGMGEAATPFSKTFIAAGMPDDFVQQLGAAADAMLNALSERAQSRGKRGGVTKGLGTKLGRGRRLVQVLDALVKGALKDDPALLTNWNIVKRVQRTAGRPTSSATVPTPTPASNPATPAASKARVGVRPHPSSATKIERCVRPIRCAPRGRYCITNPIE